MMRTADRSRDVRVVAAGDAALVLELENRLDPAVNTRAVAVAAALARERPAGVRDVVTSYRSVTVYFDPLGTAVDRLSDHLEALGKREWPEASVALQPITIPVCYGGGCGPDRAEVAAFASCSEEDVVRLHTSTTVRVYMLGFVPGFAYMAAVDERIAMPRRSTPRLRVPERAVGIAGPQTGIYPIESPGGWRLIGRTPLRPFDPARENPFLFKPGDLVRFQAITADEFEAREREARLR
jgi:KipI family sensor histidine kinase inhibitor